MSDETTIVASATPNATGDDGKYLRVAGVTKKFGEFTALDCVSFDVEHGEFVVFLGPSGCGKTTMLRIIAGLEVQTEGLIYQAGQEISALPPAQRDFGIVFQSYALFPNLSIFDNIAYGLVSQRRPKNEVQQRVDELLHLIGLPEEVKKYPGQLSGGQQQRVAVARAIATNPGLLLLDEPLSALDARVRIHLRIELKRLQRRLGVTTVMVTHDQGEAMTMADRVVVMNHGVIEQVGTPSEIYQQPTTQFVADFIGTTNFLNGTVIEDGMVRVGNIDVACDTEGNATNAPVVLAIRSEEVHVGDGAVNGADAFAATVDDIEFNGAFCRAHLKLDGLGDRLLIADVPIGAVRDQALASGTVVPVELPRELIRAFQPG